MIRKRVLCLAAALTAAVMPLAAGQHEHNQLGTVTFPTSCDPKVRAEFERGVAMLHSYWFSYAGKTFRSVLAQDPDCAMAHWGIALDLLGNTLSAPPSADNARAAWNELEKARPLDVTPRERGWLDAIRAYFRNHETVSVDERLQAYNKAMRELAERHPEDFEAQVYYALTLQASAPKTDITYANQLESARILEKLYAQNPQHPGITHYLIHAYDYPPFAGKGIAAARRYAAIAPAVPHARHMPAHIYSMAGLWKDSIASNLSALEIQPDYYHAADFAVYAYLQLGQDTQAASMLEKSLNTPPRADRPAVSGLADQTARAAMPARYALERADWAGAAALRITSSSYPQADALTRFTRGLGMARLKNGAGAKQEITALEQLQSTLRQSGDRYWADRVGDQMLAVSAWTALAEGQRDRAVSLARQAAESENRSLKHVAMENRLYPMRELLGDLLLETGQATAALAEYEQSLEQHPNRYRGLYGAARAAEAAGERVRASDFYRKLLELAEGGGGTRPELQKAREFVARSQ